MSSHQLSIFSIFLLGLCCSAMAQTAPVEVHHAPWNVDSGPLRTEAAVVEAVPVFSHVVSVRGASWLRLHFADVQLSGSRNAGTGAFVRVTSLRDFAVQELDSATIREWRNSTAYLNGDTVLVELWAFPGTGDSRVEIDFVTHGSIEDGGVASICGEDDRIPFNDPRVARVWPVGCTAFLINHTEFCFLSAGHCAGNIFLMDVVQFNVPLSDSSGNPIHPPPEHQYMIDWSSIQFVDGGVGNDWCYFGAYPNSVTGLSPFQAQGARFMLANAPSPTNSAIQLTGYGADNEPPQHNYICQTDIGTYSSLSGTTISYDDLDTEPGNSGSPIHHLELDRVIGIHSHGGCHLPLGSNKGTAIQNAGLQEALSNPQGISASPPVHQAISRAFTVVPPPPPAGPQPPGAVSRAFTIMIVEEPPCLPADLDCNGVVNVFDLLELLAAWGPCPDCDNCPADLDDDCNVNVFDLLILLANWG